MREIQPGNLMIKKFKSIQSVIFAVLSVLLLGAVIIITVISLSYTRQSVFENSSLYTQTIIQQMNQNIDSYIDYMENTSYLVSSNEDVQKYLFGDTADPEARDRILSQFETILDSRSDILNLGIIAENGRMLINNGQRLTNQDLDIHSQEWYTNALEGRESVYLTSSHVQHIISGERPWVITLSRGIRNKEMGTGQEKEGVFFIDLNYNAISELCDQSMVGNQGYAFIVDADGNIVYHPQQQQLYNELQTENIDLVMNAGSDIVTWGDGINKKMYSISRSEKTGWTVVDCVRVEELLRRSNEAQSIYVLVAIGLMAVALFFSRFVAKSITLPIQRLCDSMERVQEGDFSVSDIVVDSENEIGSLTKSFNVMTQRIHELMAQNIWEQEAKRKSELKALQSQINPHFLYNTLDIIRWEAMYEAGGESRVTQMIEKFSQLCRMGMCAGGNTITLKEGIEHAKTYLEVLNFRHTEKIGLEIKCEAQENRLYMPQFILQPIMENSVIHGFEDGSHGFSIRIRAFCREEKLLLYVQDNGKGMDEQELELLRESMERTETEEGSIGLANVHQRIRLFYGEEYGLRINSRAEFGTEVEISLPVRYQSENMEGNREE